MNALGRLQDKHTVIATDKHGKVRHAWQGDQEEPMYRVLCTMYYVLCTMYYVLCTMYYVLCTHLPEARKLSLSWETWWPQTAKQEGDDTCKNSCINGTNVRVIAQILELSLAGVGAVLRLEIDASSMVDARGKHRMDASPSPSSRFGSAEIIYARVWSSALATRVEGSG